MWKLDQKSEGSSGNVHKNDNQKLLLSIVILQELAIPAGLLYNRFFYRYWTSCREEFVD